jgi:hypothetical protein
MPTKSLVLLYGLNIMVLKLRNDGLVIRKTIKRLLPNAFVPAIVHHAKR